MGKRMRRRMRRRITMIIGMIIKMMIMIITVRYREGRRRVRQGWEGAKGGSLRGQVWCQHAAHMAHMQY